ncbi:uncharacterized protein METZ01_LOCUS398321 [marine metagenome]|uniref:Uncharacterized protein n=1 Tax=marine metagenome TaxID=408172 RepID=A0A382VG70_9ZZZZ
MTPEASMASQSPVADRKTKLDP